MYVLEPKYMHPLMTNILNIELGEGRGGFNLMWKTGTMWVHTFEPPLPYVYLQLILENNEKLYILNYVQIIYVTYIETYCISTN